MLVVYLCTAGVNLVCIVAIFVLLYPFAAMCIDLFVVAIILNNPQIFFAV